MTNHTLATKIEEPLVSKQLVHDLLEKTYSDQEKTLINMDLHNIRNLCFHYS